MQNLQNIVLMVVILFLVIWILFGESIKQQFCDESMQKPKCLMENLEDPQSTTTPTTSSVTSTTQGQEDAGEYIQKNKNPFLYTGDTGVYSVNRSGIDIRSDGVNSGLQMGENGDKYAIKYADIVKGEIGQDTLASQQQYKDYVHSDNSLRYIDTEISGAALVPFVGLSLTRMSKPPVFQSDSTQNVSQSIDDLATNSGGILRNFINKQIV